MDDMFVIVQCYDQLKPHELQLPMHERMGLTMKHAGMSILVTSITDICAFAVGSTTVSWSFLHIIWNQIVSFSVNSYLTLHLGRWVLFNSF